MSLREIVIDGTLKPDGTLELDRKPELAPGRVRVVVQRVGPVPQAAAPEGLWHFLQRTRRELEATGSHFMNQEEVRAHLAWLREPDRTDEMLH